MCARRLLDRAIRTPLSRRKDARGPRYEPTCSGVLNTTRRSRDTGVQPRVPCCLGWLLPRGDRCGATDPPTQSSPTLAAPKRKSRGDANSRADGQSQWLRSGSSRVLDVARRSWVRPIPSSSRAHVPASSTRAGTGIAATHAWGRFRSHSPDERIQRHSPAPSNWLIRSTLWHHAVRHVRAVRQPPARGGIAPGRLVAVREAVVGLLPARRLSRPDAG